MHTVFRINEMENIATFLIKEDLDFNVESVGYAMHKLKNRSIFGNRTIKNIFDKMASLSKS